MDQHVSALNSELQQLDQAIASAPTNPQLYVQRGMTRFKLGLIADSIADFDQAELLNPSLTPYLWQRGLAYYYAERFEEGARQFEIDLTVNGQDVEETVWRYLCQAQIDGAQAAREALLPVRNDPRPVMARVYQLFAGECNVDAVLAPNPADNRHSQFYSYLYVGLYAEAEPDSQSARQYITQAAEMQRVDDYMGWLAIVHQHLRGWGSS